MNNRNEWNGLLRVCVVLIGAVLSIACIYLSFYLKFGTDIPTRNIAPFSEFYIWIMIGFVVINLLFGTYVFYNKQVMDLFYTTMLSQLVLTFYLMALSYAGSWLSFPRSVILINFFVSTLVIFLYNFAIYRLYQKVRGSKSVMVVGKSERALEAVKNFESMGNRRHEVTHAVLDNYLYHIKALSDEVDIVYLTGHIKESTRLEIYEYLMKSNKKLFISTNFENLMMVNPNIMHFEDESIIEVSEFKISAEEGLIKRMIDVVISLVMLIVTSPIMVVTAIAIKLDSPGPILYQQERVTKDQRTFNILKFRSMTQEAESTSGPVLATSNDARVTKVGKFIRSTRIDELPQLFNVLKGDMSMVGPRPERPFFVEQFAEQNPYYRLRHHVRAGITGYAQVYGKYSTDFNSKLNFDLLYIKNYSLTFDFKLMFQTLKILFDKVSSRGVDETSDNRSNRWSDYEDRMKIIQ
ncbi:UDP-phosphate galactose phosphotransferase [Suicoccus acidiformans]|uniref:UDP-phosphate galactose phosphotransferase n=1 Tax=Suicoccus acidiformans TaxID=2036206 RepID=A0A347WND4_9LACT|nr:sugar transferase [Suicoccus acidiformans]AXY26591.1 UDP-phosphate galactose phosphotransferase [Suicoccus acidiformans]